MDITNKQDLVKHVKKAIEIGKNKSAKLPLSVLKIKGMFCGEARHFLNTICSFKGCGYLEVGSYQGASLISALYQNIDTHGVAIDNFSRFDPNNKNRDILDENIAKFLKDIDITFIQQDCWSVDLSILEPPFNVYFYDGSHSKEAQEKAFTYFNTVLANPFIAIIDDYRTKETKIATQKAFKDLNYNVIYEQVLGNKAMNSHNCIYVAVIEKK